MAATAVYKSNMKRAMLSEGRALMSTLLTAQKTYYAEWAYFYEKNSAWNTWCSYDPVLGIDARGNKYFTLFSPSNSSDLDAKTIFTAYAPVPKEAQSEGKNWMRMKYDVHSGYIKNAEGFEECEQVI